MNVRIIKKTYKKIDNIAKGGIDNIFLYKELIDNSLLNDEYDELYEVFLRYYNIDIKQYESLDDVKEKTFDKVRLLTSSIYEDNVKRLQKNYGFYNIGLDIFDQNNAVLGQIYTNGNINFVTTPSGTYIIEGIDDFDIYKKSIDKIYSEIG